MPFRYARLSAVIAAVALLTPAAILSGCGSSSSGSSGQGTLRVAMVDAPDPSVSSVVVTIDRVEAHVDNDWVTITSGPQTLDLIDLVENEVILGSATLPAGHYTQIRLFPSSATVTDDDGTHPVTIPSGVQTGIKVNVNHDIEPGGITVVLLDFNVHKSFHKLGNGQYHLQPVIPGVVKVISGTITGNVTRSGAPVHGAVVTATYTAGSNYPVGTEVNSTMTLEDGDFKVWALLPGTYTVSASFTDPVTNVTSTASMTGVVVTANQNTAVGNLALQ